MAIPNIQFPWRDGIKFISYGGYLVILGGWNAGTGVFTPGPSTNQILISSDNGLNWTLLGTAPWSIRHFFGCIVKGTKLYVIGGDPATPQKDVWTYDLTVGVSGLATALNWTRQTNNWGTVGGNRNSQGFYVYGGKIRMAGGQDFTGNTSGSLGIMFTDVVELDETTWTWSVVGTLPISYAATTVFLQDGANTWLFGGVKYNEPLTSNGNANVYKSTNGGNTWTLFTALPASFTGYSYANGFFFDNKLFIQQGSDLITGSNIKGVWCYDFVKSIWIKLDSPVARHASWMCIHNSELYIISGNYANDVVKYTKVIVL